MKLTNFILFLFLLQFLDKATQASVVIDPFVGGEIGLWKSEESFPLAGQDVTGTQRGLGLGLYYGSRVYIDFMKALIIGVGYYQTKNQWNYSNSDDTNDDSWKNVSATRKSLNLFFGLQKPGSKGPLYKIWFGFGPSETLALNEAHQPSKSPVTYQGTSLFLGYSLPFKGWFYLNFEFSRISMNKRKQDGNEVTIPYDKNFEAYKSFEFNTLLASISMPVSLFSKKVGW